MRPCPTFVTLAAFLTCTSFFSSTGISCLSNCTRFATTTSMHHLFQGSFIFFPFIFVCVRFNISLGRSLGCRATYFLFFIIRVLVHSHPIHFVFNRIALIFHHLAETTRKTTSFRPAVRSTVISLAGAVVRTLSRETPLGGNSCIHQYIHWFTCYFSTKTCVCNTSTVHRYHQFTVEKPMKIPVVPSFRVRNFPLQPIHMLRGKMLLMELPIITNRITPVILLFRMWVTCEVVVITIKQNIKARFVSKLYVVVPLSRSWPISSTRSIPSATRCYLVTRTHKRLSNIRIMEGTNVAFDGSWLNLEDIDFRCTPPKTSFHSPMV
mmetsp:Transcript_31467/g.46233  ORF Transcript_31467/g.46233 Transcript_31467/m.46233 type:complete len:322 (-) Transcript_31467:785-1750(-)